jgi:cold-inducible RNA-binding protein
MSFWFHPPAFCPPDWRKKAKPLNRMNLMQDKVTGHSRGFAFVEHAAAEEANKAVEQFHNKEFQGRALTVNRARPRSVFSLGIRV